MAEIKQLKRGEIAVSKKTLKDYCNALRIGIRTLDLVMKEPESYERGKKIAKVANHLDMTRQRIELFCLGLNSTQINLSGTIK